MWSLYSVAVISWLIILIGMVATALLFVVANANVGKIIETSKSVICIKNGRKSLTINIFVGLIFVYKKQL